MDKGSSLIGKKMAAEDGMKVWKEKWKNGIHKSRGKL
jgi:hypothetical protein